MLETTNRQLLLIYTHVFKITPWSTPLLLSASMINYPSRRRKMKPWFKANSMMQWTERNQNKTFVNLPSLRWKSEISEAIHLVQPGLTAGRQAGR